MAQKRFFNFKHSLQSNEFNFWLLGILAPGRYVGFDAFANVSGLNFDLVHTTTGIEQTLEDLTQTDPTGVVLSKSGCVVQEDAAISLSCTTNAANGSIRTDVVVMTYEDVNVIGGQAATYSVIRGTDGTSAEPALTNPETQVKIGTITIPANAANLSGATYSPAQCPLLGGHSLLTEYPELNARFAKLGSGGPNEFTTQNREAQASNMTIASGKITFANNGNSHTDAGGSYTVNEIEEVRTGFVAKIFASGTITLNLSASPAVGGAAIVCDALTSAGVTSITLQPGDYVELLQVEIFSTPLYMITNMSNTIQRSITDIESAMALANPDSLITTLVQIGDWDMDANSTKSVSLGSITSDKVRSITGMIRNDADNAFYPLPYIDATPDIQAWIGGSGSGSVTLLRLTGGFFDSTNFNQTSFNRGHLVVVHEA